MERLPEECISRVLCCTSPRDVSRLSAVSKALLSAAKSDLVWDRFLPPDYEEILHRSSPPVAFSSKRDLYFRLCDSIHIDAGSKILWLEKATGKKCCMVSARALTIIWGDDHRYWRWISLPDARFPEVAELLDVCWLDINASVSSRELSPATRYGAHLVMRYSDRTYGLVYPPQKTVVSVGGVHASSRTVKLQGRGVEHHHPWGFPGDGVGVEEEGEEEEEEEEVSSPPADEAPVIERGVPDQPAASGGHSADESDASDYPSPDQVGQPSDQGEGICVPGRRGDTWMELEMGDFFIEAGGEERVDMRLQGQESLYRKSGIIVHGVEMRPLP